MLLVDIGNSRIKWGIKTSAKLEVGPPFPNQTANITREMESLWGHYENLERVVISNVAGAKIAESVQNWCYHHWNISAEIVQPQTRAFGVRNGYHDASKLGVDRWVGLVAIRHEYDLPACLVDCGTAITLDFLDPTGVHGGGLIMPGISMMRNALLKGAHGIGMAGSETAEYLADNTQNAIGNGTIYSAVGFVELVLNRLRVDHGNSLTVVFTGGGQAQVIADKVSFPTNFDSDLILKGLSIIAG